MPEQELTDITKELINELTSKYPKKRLQLKEYLKLNSIEVLDELPEELGLDILEQMDSVYYVRAIKRKRELEAEQYHQSLVNAVDEFLADEIETYILLEKVEDAWLVSKRINVSVEYKNNNNVFHEYGRSDAKEYFIVLIIKVSDTYIPTPLMAKFMARGIRQVRIVDAGGIFRTMKEIT